MILQKGKKFTKYLHSWNSSFAHRCFCMDVCLAWETKHEGIHFHRMEIQIGQTNLESLLRCHGGEMLPTALLVFTLAHLPFFGNGTGMAYSLTATRWWSPPTNVNIAPELEKDSGTKRDSHRYFTTWLINRYLVLSSVLNAIQRLLYSFYPFLLMFSMLMTAELCEKTVSFCISSWTRACVTGVLHLTDTRSLGQKQGAGVIFMRRRATQM